MFSIDDSDSLNVNIYELASTTNDFCFFEFPCTLKAQVQNLSFETHLKRFDWINMNSFEISIFSKDMKTSVYINISTKIKFSFPIELLILIRRPSIMTCYN